MTLELGGMDQQIALGHGSLQPGDLQGEIAAYEAQEGLRLVQESGLLTYLETHDPECLPWKSQVALAETYLNANTLNQEYDRSRNTLAEMSARMRNAQVVMPNGTYANAVRARLSVFPGALEIVSDVDNTFTDQSYKNGSKVDPMLPGSGILDPMYSGRPVAEVNRLLPAISELGWVPFMEARPDLYRRSGEEVPLRKGAENLGRFTAERYGRGITFASRGFQVSADAIAERIPTVTAGHTVHAIDRGTVNSGMKEAFVGAHIAKNPGRPVLYIGDGGSDEGVAQLAANPDTNALAGICALRGGSFSRSLDEKGIPHMQFTDLDEVVAFLDQVS